MKNVILYHCNRFKAAEIQHIVLDLAQTDHHSLASIVIFNTYYNTTTKQLRSSHRIKMKSIFSATHQSTFNQETSEEAWPRPRLPILHLTNPSSLTTKKLPDS